MNDDSVYDKIDLTVQLIDRYAAEPQFSRERQHRQSLHVTLAESDTEVLRSMCVLIAYSQAARSVAVTELLPRLDEAFEGYDPSRVAVMSAADLKARHWHVLGEMRYRRKLQAMVDCAKALLRVRNDFPTFMTLVAAVGLPAELARGEDIDRFWREFAELRRRLAAYEFPFVSSLTTLCHFLKDRGYPCLKPDSSVMEAATSLGIVDRRKQYPDSSRRHVVTVVQHYALERRIRMAVLDWYLLIRGGMGWAQQFVRREYYNSGARE